MSEHDDVRAAIEKWALSEGTSRVDTYSTWLHGAELTVRVHDRGAAAGDERYAVEVFDAKSTPSDRDSENYRYSLSNGEPDVDTALSTVHWNQFGPMGE